MVKRCSYGMCKSDTRYPDRVQGVKFISFPKPKRNRDKCLRWIRACGRPHNQLNTERISKDHYVCTKHFNDPDGPSSEFPDPRPVDGSPIFRVKTEKGAVNDGRLLCPEEKEHKPDEVAMVTPAAVIRTDGPTLNTFNSSTQTEGAVHTDLDMFSHLATIRRLEEEIKKLRKILRAAPKTLRTKSKVDIIKISQHDTHLIKNIHSNCTQSVVNLESEPSNLPTNMPSEWPTCEMADLESENLTTNIQSECCDYYAPDWKISKRDKDDIGTSDETMIDVNDIKTEPTET